jgi:hypothetical protein
MLHPLMALLAVVGLGATGGTASQPNCTVETEAGATVVATQAQCREVARLREERDQLRQDLSEREQARPEDRERATGGAGEAGQSEPLPSEAPKPPEVAPPPPVAPPPVAVPPSPVAPPAAAEQAALSEELRALRREVAELRRAVKEAEARAIPPAPPAVPAKAVEAAPVREEKSERERALELLRNTDTLTVQNANPVERQVLGEVNVANRTQTGEVGFLLAPQVRVGTPWHVEFGAGAQLQNLAGEAQGTTGAVGAYALGQLVEEKRVLPQVSLRGQVTSPQGDEGVSAEARVLATKTFGQTRLHGNVGYSARQDTADDYLLGLAADHPIGDRLLLQGDAYYTNPLGAEEGSVNASVGTGLRVGSSFVVTGAVGVSATAADVAPRLLLGVLGRI